MGTDDRQPFDPLLLAYCAGVIDSDGTIGVKRSTYSMRRVGDCSAPSFSERVCVKQVEREAIDVIWRVFGGTRYVARAARNTPRGRQLFVWQVTDRRAAACLSALLPYLRIKRAQAENCLSLRVVKEESKKARVAPGRGHVGSAPRSPAMTAAMESHYSQAKALNRVGVR